jgi:predicted NAD/FAD-binding protein
MPIRREAWSAWNYITQSPSQSSDSMPSSVCLTYNMNILQHIPVETMGDVLVTLNPIFPPSPSLTQGSWAYSHPLYNPNAIRCQALLPEIQNRRGISYCGAWTKYGFHEDGFSSGVKVAIDHLDASIPWDFVDGTFIRGKRPRLTWRDYAVRVLLWYIQSIITIISWLVGRS